MTHSNKRAAGFTLIELTMVIVILGILAATALPKFVDMSKDARIAAVNGMAGTLRAASEIAHAKCAVSSGCLVEGVGAAVTFNGASYQMRYGYPIDSNRDGFWGINQWVNYQGFSHSTNATFAYFDKEGAPTPAGCRASYEYRNSEPAITTVTTGC